MAKKGTFLLRTDPEVLDALRRWANDEFRSVNGQIEFMLRRALQEAGRLKSGSPPDRSDAPSTDRSDEVG